MRQCSACQSALRKVFARGVELDWCPFCGGVHFDRGELAGVLRREVPLVRSDEAHGTCAACGGTLRRAKVGQLSTRACEGCEGVFLDAGVLDELAGAHVGLLQLPDERPREAITFHCARCGAEAPLEEGLTTSGGLVCSSCRAFSEGGYYPPVPPPPPDVPLEVAQVAVNVGAATLPGGWGTVFELISLVFQLFE